MGKIDNANCILDVKDLKILGELDNDSRQSNSKIGKKSRIKQGSCKIQD